MNISKYIKLNLAIYSRLLTCFTDFFYSNSMYCIEGNTPYKAYNPYNLVPGQSFFDNAVGN